MLMILALPGASVPARGQLMLMLLALAGRLRPSKGPTDADDSCPAGRLSPSKGPTDADAARPCPAPSVPARGQLMLMMLALAGRLRPSKC